MFDEVCFNLIVVEGICFLVFILKFNFVDNCLLLIYIMYIVDYV